MSCKNKSTHEVTAHTITSEPDLRHSAIYRDFLCYLFLIYINESVKNHCRRDTKHRLVWPFSVAFYYFLYNYAKNSLKKNPINST